MGYLQMGAWRTRIRCLFDKLLGMRLCYQMAVVYAVGGALPVILIGMYLIQGTNRILVEREQQAELSELNLMSREAENLFGTVNSVSKSFYFDQQLEHIAGNQYQEYQEIVDDYRAYTTFNSVRNLYSRQLSYITLFVENDTIAENAQFVKVDKEIRSQAWYQRVMNQGGGGVWQYLSFHLDNNRYLALSRLLRTQKGEKVGVLVVYLRMERLEELLGQRKKDTCIVLNQNEVIAGEDVRFSQIRDLLDDQGKNDCQKKIELDGEEYLLTCAAVGIGETKDHIQIVSIKSYQDILKRANQQNQRSLIIFLASAFLSVSMIFLFSRAFSGRVNRFHRQMQKAAVGDFNLEKSLGGNDEISELYGYLWTMIRDIQRLLSQIYQERLHAEQLKTRQREVEFKMLASQINPHFLYNTLEIIRMKARINHQPEIEELVKMLAKILRSNVSAGDMDVPLQQELTLVESYLKIQQYRFDERLEYRINVEEALRKIPVLPLILQPLVENSIIHGMEDKEGVVHIDISACWDGEDVLVIVEDDGLGIEPEMLKALREGLNSRELNKTHIGICNVHQRLRLKYGAEYGLTIESEAGSYTRVAVRLPFGEI